MMYKAEELMVCPMDMAALDVQVKKECNQVIIQNGKKTKKNYLVQNRKLCISSANGMVFMVDQECIGQVFPRDSKRKRFLVEVYPDLGPKKFACFAEYQLSLTQEEAFKLALVDQQVSLKDFMGDRYNYNGRIESNMASLLDAIEKGGHHGTTKYNRLLP